MRKEGNKCARRAEGTGALREEACTHPPSPAEMRASKFWTTSTTRGSRAVDDDSPSMLCALPDSVHLALFADARALHRKASLLYAIVW